MILFYSYKIQTDQETYQTINTILQILRDSKICVCKSLHGVLLPICAIVCFVNRYYFLLPLYLLL